MQISKFKLVVAGVLAAIGFSFLGAGTAVAIEEHMANARDHLRQAQDELGVATPDKDGHRDRAAELVRQAREQVDMGIQSVG